MQALSASGLRLLMNLWPPLLAAGVRVVRLDDDFRHAEVELRMRPWNRNYVGAHFGGSLFAMTDPFWMIMVMRNLGREYRVWDRAAEISFDKPGRGVVRACFALSEERLQGIRAETADGDKHLTWFETDVVDEGGETVARVRKQLYVRRKQAGDVAIRR